MTASETLTDTDFWDAAWEELASRVHRLSASHPYFGRRGIFTKMIERQLGSIRGLRVMELGGGGVNYRLLAMHQWCGADVSAIDFSPVSLKLLEQVFAQNGARVHAEFGDIFQLKTQEKYDLVVHWGVVEHFADPAAVLKISQQLLKPGGRILFTMPNMEAWGHHLWQRWSPDNWSKHVLHRDEAIERASIESGLKLKSGFHFGYPMLKLAEWEKRGLLPQVGTWTQRFFSASGYVFPWYHAVGGRKVSMERGFVLQDERTTPSNRVAA